MTEDLFGNVPGSYHIPNTEPDKVTLYRSSFAKAQAEYEKASTWEDESGEPVPDELKENVEYYRRKLMKAESEAIEKLKRTKP